MAVADAEADEDAPPAEEKGKKKLSRKMLIIIAAAAVLLVGGGASAWFFLFSSKPVENLEAVIEVPESFIFNLPPMTVNLSSEGEEGGGDQFLKITIALEVADQKVMEDIQPRMAKVVDAFQVYLRELRKSDLEGSAGIYRLKEELRRRVNVAIFPAQVESILFKEILIQ